VLKSEFAFLLLVSMNVRQEVHDIMNFLLLRLTDLQEQNSFCFSVLFCKGNPTTCLRGTNICWLPVTVTVWYHTKCPKHYGHFLIYCASPSESLLIVKNSWGKHWSWSFSERKPLLLLIKPLVCVSVLSIPQSLKRKISVSIVQQHTTISTERDMKRNSSPSTTDWLRLKCFCSRFSKLERY
jgi:hypothetical protein